MPEHLRKTAVRLEHDIFIRAFLEDNLPKDTIYEPNDDDLDFIADTKK